MRYPWNNKRVCFLILALVLLPQLVLAGVEWKILQKVKLESRALDVTASFDGTLIFSLTPGAILVYATADNRFIDRIPVGASYTRLAYSNENRLILSAANPAAFEIIKYDRIYDINISNRPYEGAADAKVTLVVFDDYQ